MGDISSGKTWGAYKVNMLWCCAVVAKTKRIIIIELGNLQKNFVLCKFLLQKFYHKNSSLFLSPVGYFAFVEQDFERNNSLQIRNLSDCDRGRCRNKPILARDFFLMFC